MDRTRIERTEMTDGSTRERVYSQSDGFFGTKETLVSETRVEHKKDEPLSTEAKVAIGSAGLGVAAALFL